MGGAKGPGTESRCTWRCTSWRSPLHRFHEIKICQCFQNVFLSCYFVIPWKTLFGLFREIGLTYVKPFLVTTARFAWFLLSDWEINRFLKKNPMHGFQKLNKILKGNYHEIFRLRFFHQRTSPGPNSHA
jgi:hypothetical protein